MLQPLAITIVYGLSFSMLVSLLLVPAMYRIFAPAQSAPAQQEAKPAQIA
jgi:multidrug efflux pump subunit AcrB